MHFSLFLIIGKLNWETYKERLKPGRQKTNKLSRKFSNFQNNSIEMQSLQYLFSSQNNITNYQNFRTKFKHILRKKCKPQLHWEKDDPSKFQNWKPLQYMYICHSISTCSATQWYFNSFVWCDNWLHIQMRVVWKHLVYLLLDIFWIAIPHIISLKWLLVKAVWKWGERERGKGVMFSGGNEETFVKRQTSRSLGG